MTVDQRAQVVFDRERHSSGDHPPHVHQPPARDHGADDHQCENQQRVAVVGALGKLAMLGMGGALLNRFHSASP